MSGLQRTPALDEHQHLVNMPHDNDAVHQGDVYTVSKWLNLGAGSSLDVLIHTTNASERMHINAIADVEAESALYLYEGINMVASGTSLSPYNNSRCCADDSKMSLRVSPTVTSVDTTLLSTKAGGGSHARGFGGSADILNHFILAPAETYLFRISAVDAGWVSSQVTWHEE